MFDELFVSGDVIWLGVGLILGSDGWIVLYFVDLVFMMLVELVEIDFIDVYWVILVSLGIGGVYFFC